MKLLRIFLLTFSLFFTVWQAEAHPYHLSLAEVKFNAKTQKLEIALKIFTDDLEKTLSISAKKPVVMNHTPEIKKQLEAYLKQNFRLENEARKIYPQQFLGYETEADAQWLYLEIPVKTQELEKSKFRNQVLLEVYNDQMNLMNLDLNGQKKTLIFKEGEVVKLLF